MADLPSYYAGAARIALDLMDDSDCKTTHSDCGCVVCEDKRMVEKKLEVIFEDCNNITVHTHEGLELYQYLLCPKKMPVFSFKTRTWGMAY